MTRSRPRSIVVRAALVTAVGALLPVFACAAGDGTPAPEDAAVEEEAPVLTGVVAREEIEEAVPDWVSRTVEAEIDEAAATALASVEPGAEITVFLGTWCSDSRREVPRFWRALDQVGGLVPFEVEYVAVDREKVEPAERVGPAEVRYVPTFVVRRNGEEVGRVVETSPNGVETDILSLLEGEASGVLSEREDL